MHYFWVLLLAKPAAHLNGQTASRGQRGTRTRGSSLHSLGGDAPFLCPRASDSIALQQRGLQGQADSRAPSIGFRLLPFEPRLCQLFNAVAVKPTYHRYSSSSPQARHAQRRRRWLIVVSRKAQGERCEVQAFGEANGDRR